MKKIVAAALILGLVLFLIPMGFRHEKAQEAPDSPAVLPDSGKAVTILIDGELQEMDLTVLDMIILPGGLGGVTSVRASEGAMNALRFAWDNGKYVAAICAGPTVLADLGITSGKQATCFPGCEDGMGDAVMIPGAAAVTDGRLITGTSAGCAIPFGLELIAALRGKNEAERIKNQIVIR